MERCRLGGWGGLFAWSEISGADKGTRQRTETGRLAAIAYGTRKPEGENTSGRFSGVVKGGVLGIAYGHWPRGELLSFYLRILAIYPLYPVLQ